MVRDATKLSDELRDQISDALKPLRPEKVILFGSYGRQIMTEEARLL